MHLVKIATGSREFQHAEEPVHTHSVSFTLIRTVSGTDVSESTQCHLHGMSWRDHAA